MGTIQVTDTINTLEVSDTVLNVTIQERVNNVTIAPIGIQGPKGDPAYPTLEANKILTNDGVNVMWTDAPNNLTIDAMMNGGYF